MSCRLTNFIVPLAKVYANSNLFRYLFSMRSLKSKLIALIFCLLVSLTLTSCSLLGGKSQAVIIVIEDGTTSLLPITNSLQIFAKGSEPLDLSDIQSSAAAEDKIVKANQDDIDWLSDCEGDDNECMTYKGVKYLNTKVSDFYSPESFIKSKLDINDKGYAVLKVSEKDRSATWQFDVSKDSKDPIYLKILVTDYYVAITQLKGGYLTYTSTIPEEEIPEKSSDFKEFITFKVENVFQRPNKWIEFKAAYTDFSIAKSDASDKTCEIFGKECKGRASWSVIQKKYMKVYEEDISTMASNLPTFSEDSEVRKALLMLSQTADLLANCYFRTQLAASSRDDASYNAVSSCWQDVDQKLGEIEIYLNDFNLKMDSFARVGDH